MRVDPWRAGWLVLMLCACGEDAGRGAIVGTLTVPDCENGQTERFDCGDDVPADRCEAFDLNADFFALETFERSAVLRIQRGGRAFAQNDGVLLQIRDVRRLRGNLGVSLPVGPEANIRGALGLFETCPDTTQNFELQGEVVFERFGVDKGDEVVGRVLWLEVRDGRGGGPGQVLGLLRGGFDFKLRKGPPHQRFTGS